VVGLEAAQAVLHLADDPAARVAAHVDVLAHLGVRLGGQHHVVATAEQGLADDLLRLPRRVDIRGVDEVDAAVQRGMNDPDALLVIGIAPRAEHHRAEAVRAHLDPGTAECPHPHVCRLPFWPVRADALSWVERLRTRSSRDSGFASRFRIPGLADSGLGGADRSISILFSGS
jgi:hypothetical protein